MPFINNQKFNEIRNAAKNNNPKALEIMQVMQKNGSQDDINRLIDSYYGIETPLQQPQPQLQQQPAEENIPLSEPQEVPDITELLDGETDGLFDENDIDYEDFSTFLNNKKRDNLRAKKNLDYFSAFDPQGRNNYVEAKKEAYKSKFGDKVHDIERKYDDYDKALGLYVQGVNDSLDDDLGFDANQVDGAYNEIIGNNSIMHSFGRHWDNVDTSHIIDDLKQMCAQYGKKNILAALNTIKNDNVNYRNYQLGKINQEVDRYDKILDKTLIK